MMNLKMKEQKLKKNSFILYHSYQKHLNLLTNEQRGILLTALFEYSDKQIIPALDPVSMMAFNFIAEDMDINRDKWEEMAEVRSEAGRKGAEARWKGHTKDSDKEDKIANDGKRILPMANDGKNAVNVNVNVKDNVNNISKDIGDKPQEYGNSSITKVQKALKEKYPIPLTGITDRRKVYNLIQVLTKRKNQDQWMSDEWKKNLVAFMNCYMEGTQEQYLVKSVDTLKEKAKLWREYEGKLN
jgi:hypothetical protein